MGSHCILLPTMSSCEGWRDLSYVQLLRLGPDRLKIIPEPQRLAKWGPIKVKHRNFGLVVEGRKDLGFASHSGESTLEAWKVRSFCHRQKSLPEDKANTMEDHKPRERLRNTVCSLIKSCQLSLWNFQLYTLKF